MAKLGNSGNRHRHVTETPDASHIRNVDVTHELSDVDIRGILTFVVGLTVLTIVVYLLMFLMFKTLNKQEESKEPKPAPMALSEKERLPPEPRLQAAPGFGEELEKQAGVKRSEESAALKQPKDRLWEFTVLQQQWNEVLEHGPKDQSGRLVGLPIEEAKKRLLEAGLPSRPQVSPPQSIFDYGVDMPTAASSGRVTEKRRQ